MDPNDLRACVEEAIRTEIEPVAWQRCVKVNKAEQESSADGPRCWGQPPEPKKKRVRR